MKKFFSGSAEETIRIGQQFGKTLKDNAVICFFGDLAAGKTTFIKGIASGVANIHLDEVSSPTFVFLNIYAGIRSVFHFDLYRLKDSDEFLGMGFDEFFDRGICCIEWSERIANMLPPNHIKVELLVLGEEQREISIL